MKRLGIGIFSVVLITGFWCEKGRTSTLTTCNEASLRAAIAAGGTIEFGCSGTIILTQPLIVSQDATLDARGHTVLLNGGGTTRVLQVQGATLRLVNIIFTNGYARDGAALYNDGGFVIAERCTFSGNQAVGYLAFGGAIYNSSSLVLTQCVLTKNLVRGGAGADGSAGTPGTSDYDQFGRCRPITPAGNGTSGQRGGAVSGGAIYNETGGTVTIVNCTIESNTAEGGRGGNGGDGGVMAGCWGGTGSAGTPGVGGHAEGGAIGNSGTLTIAGSTIAANLALGGNGGRGGRWAMPTVSRGANGGGARGGGISNTGYLFMTNSTVADNEAAGGAGGIRVSVYPDCFPADWNATGGDAEAGGIFNSPTFVAQNVTIWNNVARGGIGGTHTNDCPPAFGPSGRSGSSSLSASVDGSSLLVNTILGNLLSTNNCEGVVTDGGYNICSDGSAMFTNSTSRNAIDPGLANLADNGGPTKTIALLADSPALDQGDPDACLPTDQRGVARPQGSACDIGAYEGTVLQLPVWTPAFAPAVVGTGAISRLAFTLHNPNAVSLTQIIFTNHFPPGFVVAHAPNKSSNYQGSFLAFAGQSRILGIINTLPAGHTCDIAVDVRAVYPGIWPDNSLQIRCAQTGHSTLTGDATLTVTGGPSDCNGEWICRFPDGMVKVRFPVPASATLVLSASYDLITWTPLMTNAGPSILEYLDQSAPGTPARFFRAQ